MYCSRTVSYTHLDVYKRQSVSNVNLKTIIGYKKDGEYHNFLDNYDAE